MQHFLVSVMMLNGLKRSDEAYGTVLQGQRITPSHQKPEILVARIFALGMCNALGVDIHSHDPSRACREQSRAIPLTTGNVQHRFSFSKLQRQNIPVEVLVL
jgi:hypothetical protein